MKRKKDTVNNIMRRHQKKSFFFKMGLFLGSIFNTRKNGKEFRGYISVRVLVIYYGTLFAIKIIKWIVNHIFVLN